MGIETHDPGKLRITVIIAVRNGAKTLQRALDSVFEQTYEHIELVVMDGASTDGTQAILERNSASIAYWESEPDRGLYHAWNKALDHATGDWICFLGADDRYHAPDVMARIATALATDDGRHRVAYGTIVVVSEDGLVARPVGRPWDAARRRRFLRGKIMPHPATFHHRTLFDRHGRFDERFRIAGDFEFLLRELLDNDPLFIDVLVTEMSAGGLSNRRSTYSLLLRERHRAMYAHGLDKAPAWRSGRLIRQLCKAWISHHVGQRTATRVGETYRFIARKLTRRR